MADAFATEFAKTFGPLLRKHAKQLLAGDERLGAGDGWLLTDEEILQAVTRPFMCVHGLPEVVQCRPCGARVVMAAMLNKALGFLTNGRQMSTDDADSMADEAFEKYGKDFDM